MPSSLISFLWSSHWLRLSSRWLGQHSNFSRWWYLLLRLSNCLLLWHPIDRLHHLLLPACAWCHRHLLLNWLLLSCLGLAWNDLLIRSSWQWLHSSHVLLLLVHLLLLLLLLLRIHHHGWILLSWWTHLRWWLLLHHRLLLSTKLCIDLLHMMLFLLF